MQPMLRLICIRTPHNSDLRKVRLVISAEALFRASCLACECRFRVRASHIYLNALVVVESACLFELPSESGTSSTQPSPAGQSYQLSHVRMLIRSPTSSTRFCCYYVLGLVCFSCHEAFSSSVQALQEIFTFRFSHVQSISSYTN